MSFRAPKKKLPSSAYAPKKHSFQIYATTPLIVSVPSEIPKRIEIHRVRGTNANGTVVKESGCFVTFYREGSTTAEIGQEEENGQVQTGNGGGPEGDAMDNGLSAGIAHDADEETAEETENVVSSEGEAPISERAASGFNESPTVGSPRVQFENIKEEDVPPFQKDDVTSDTTPGTTHEEDRKCRRHQKHEHK